MSGGRNRAAPRVVALALVALTVWLVGSAFIGGGGASVGAQEQPLAVIGRAHVGYKPALDGSKPIFILVLGSDARPGTPVDRGLSDSIHIVAVNLQKKSVTILGFPRDAWVSIPGHGSDKINAAMADGGPQLTIQLMESLTGIKFDYYMVTSFVGVENAFNDISGLTIDVPFPMHDPYSRADFNKGVQHLNGHDVLAFARDRHSLASGDFGRSEDQGRVLIAALTQLRKEYAKDPSVLLNYVGAGMRNVQTDIPLPEVIDLAFTALSFSPKKVTNLVVPGGTGMVGIKSVVFLSPVAGKIYSDLANDGMVSKKTAALAPSPTRNQPGA